MSSAVRIPTASDPFGTFDAAGAWLSLPQVIRDLIGSTAVSMVFAGFVRQDMADEPLWFDGDIRTAAGRQEDALLGALVATIDKALPEVFGTDANPPKWPQAFQAMFHADEADEQFLQRVVVEPLQSALAPFTAPSDDRRADYDIAADDAGWCAQGDGRWGRLADAHEAGAEPFGNGRHILIVGSAQDACERDGIRTDREIAAAAIAGCRRVFVPASMLAGS